MEQDLQEANDVIDAQESVIKKKVEVELEVTPNNIGVNPYQKWIHLARTVDAWRIFPRVFVGVYIVLLYKVITWFMTLPEPNLEQAGLVSIVTGAMAAVFGIYAGTSGQSKKFKGED
tara:strand:+ start:55 stop:405 length:351 start_codon:yes stop_codon:yes gene_type:complete